MNYKVCSEFFEGDHHYHVGDPYPFDTEAMNKERCDYLANETMNGAVAFIMVETKENLDDVEKTEAPVNEQYTQIKSEQLKELLTNAEIPFTEKTKKADLFKLAEEHALI